MRPSCPTTRAASAAGTVFDAADGVKYESYETEQHDEQGLWLQELFGLHPCGDGDAENDGNKVRELILS